MRRLINNDWNLRRRWFEFAKSVSSQDSNETEKWQKNIEIQFTRRLFSLNDDQDYFTNGNFFESN